MKEANLVRVLIKACLLDPKTSSDAKRAENWRQAGVKNAGQFSSVMEEVGTEPLPFYFALLNAMDSRYTNNLLMPSVLVNTIAVSS